MNVPDPDEPAVTPDPRPEDPDRGLDFDAAFAEIVARWEPDEPAAPEDEERRPPTDHAVPDQDPIEDRPDQPVLDPDEPPSPRDEGPVPWDDEGHYVPPPPPPLPPMEPPRKLAWAGLLGGPVVALLLVVLQVTIPGWAALFLVAAFVGGFGYLVATMRTGPPDDWSGDDGAVV
jgi:hypothetical protein